VSGECICLINYGDVYLPIVNSYEAEMDAMLAAAKLMAASARTAPKGHGLDRLVTAIVTGKEKEKITKAMENKSEQKKNPLARAFKLNADKLRKSPIVLLIGVKGTQPKSMLNCGACGYDTCAAFIKAEKKKGEDFTGPICVFEAIDLGIALGSAVKLASYLNIDNKMMYTIGAASKMLEILDADIIIGIPLSGTGKNIYFR
jgi:uncharacterized ferredoxin-like protein